MNITPCTIRGQPHWYVDTGRAGGRRKRMYFRDEASARKALKSAIKQRDQLGKSYDVLSAREKTAIMSVLAEMHGHGTTLQAVWRTVKALPNAPRAAKTLGEAITELLAAKKESGRRQKYIDNLEWYLGKFSKGREALPVSAVSTAVIEDWFKGRNEKPRSKNGHISTLSALFSYCARKGFIQSNPVTAIDRVHVDSEVPSTLTLKQVRKAIIWAYRRKPRVMAWLVLAMFAGLRPDAEADCISWKEIDLKNGRITIKISKIRSHRILEPAQFCPPVLEWLKVAKRLKSPLPLPFETRRRAIRGLRKLFKLRRWPQDILRHTAASNLLAYHQDAGKVASFMGNSAGVLLRDYKALIVREDAEKFMKILPKTRHLK